MLEITLSIAEFLLDSFSLFEFIIFLFVAFLELLEVDFRIILPELSHTVVLFLLFPLLLPACLDGLLLVDLQLLVLDLFRRKLVIGHIDEIKLIFLSLFFNQAKLNFKYMNLL